MSHHHTHPEGELRAFITYFAHHNDEHATELAELAEQLKDSNETAAYDKVIEAVALFREGTSLLNEALAQMKEHE